MWVANLKVPDLSSFDDRRISQSTKIYDRTGEVLLYDVNQGVKRTLVPYNQISRNVKNATIVIEDEEFYEHSGVKPTAILRAIFANILGGGFRQGGSTITQQVVKNSILTPDKKISRKLKEWVLALKLERTLSKEEILSLYLNESPYGGNIYGIEEASKTYFGKSSSALSVAESAYLAALPQAPSFYSPYGNNLDRLEVRKNLVLQKMKDLGFISPREYDTAKLEKVTWNKQEDYGIKAPHFTLFVRQLLEEHFGKEVLEKGGLKVITTLDYKLQEKAEEIVKKYALANKEKFNAENAALVAIDTETGGILAMVGSRDYFDKEIDGNFNVALAHRQPGSAFKPIVYAKAFEKGYTPETTLFDVPTEFSTYCNPDGTPINLKDEERCYKPENYDEKYRGPMTLREALAQSVNVPSVKTLYLAGIPESIRLAKDMGIKSLGDEGSYGLTLVLGGGEVSLLDLTSVYSVLARDGMRLPYKAMLRVENALGEIIDTIEVNPERVISEKTARNINDILSDNTARAPAFGERSALFFPGRQVAVKTGTTNNYRDAWVIGYTPQIAVGAWAGNNDNTPMEKKVAGFIVAPLWNEFMVEVLKNLPDKRFAPVQNEETPDKPALRGFWQGNQSYLVDRLSGKLATEFTPPELQEERVVKNIHSILYWLKKDDPLGEAPKNPLDDAQFSLWEYGVKTWATEHGIKDEDASVIPTEYDPFHRPEFFPKVNINYPPNGTSAKKSDRIFVSIISSGKYSAVKAELYINGEFVASSKKSPFSFVFVPSDLENINRENELRVVVFDSVQNRGEATIKFFVPSNSVIQ